ncbi:MAG: peptide chain release factor N(5)-glutamine methyltransferase, partial [Acholeplasmataceae bacterium]|nr:peptide chain release factor N(5)-glutamine methyltransferase [Acholeplasmataceae bacterium]
QAFVDRYLTLLDQYLINHIPVQHLIGHSYFFGYPFMVNQDVLIPRSETEQLVENILMYYDQYFLGQSIDLLDLGTGSGCIGLTLALEEKKMNVTISDISDKALEVARQNKEKLGAKAKLILSDLFDDIKPKFDIIVSNPPYIPDEEIVEDIVTKEPTIALYGGKLGTDFYEKILKAAKLHVKEKALIAFEHGYQQKDQIRLFAETNYPDAKIIQLKDLQGKDRFTFIGLGGILE